MITKCLENTQVVQPIPNTISMLRDKRQGKLYFIPFEFGTYIFIS